MLLSSYWSQYYLRCREHGTPPHRQYHKQNTMKNITKAVSGALLDAVSFHSTEVFVYLLKNGIRDEFILQEDGAITICDNDFKTYKAASLKQLVRDFIKWKQDKDDIEKTRSEMLDLAALLKRLAAELEKNAKGIDLD